MSITVFDLAVRFAELARDGYGNAQVAMVAGGEGIDYAADLRLIDNGDTLVVFGIGVEEPFGELLNAAPEPAPHRSVRNWPEPTPTPEPAAPRLALVEQLKQLAIILHNAGVVERDQRLGFLSVFAGRTLDSSKDLTAAEADEMLVNFRNLERTGHLAELVSQHA